MDWALLIGALLAAVGLQAMARSRSKRRRGEPGEEAPLRAIGELAPGRFRVVGRIVPLETSPSSVDGAACVFLEHATYGSLGGAMRREREHGFRTHAFYLDDGTGRLFVDPALADVEAATLWEDGGLTAERRLRAGEEIAVVGWIERAPLELDEAGPYRSPTATWAVWGSEAERPQISTRTEPGMLRPDDDVAAFLRGASFLLAAGAAILGVLVLLVG
ncbi:MAG TPA: hypothetical protein RMH85_10470 [Polyangiaceae bacterium LLY-WYZ-15_(1-7)]|nr:hypothetical protein [Polyangiaceae bacterium LLY-WYZ-15_(1-7)]HJL00167.1 hypothetical protein [Polyangiaceae bacterium LLY-WYZ-15_(1-7)]HJL08915.1 hypothetical protein [Polyangiaceae bacterium LLY-WYZ-15_(1-7)]HJL32580.1 hypothetical protein [Polyangiaceae bacterium LLY-WYZ-15_(1-7)]HJL35212.1 hypothetical protein [Polyangiaceae bacterium LLY-WYZ-15_(1-7)]